MVVRPCTRHPWHTTTRTSPYVPYVSAVRPVWLGGSHVLEDEEATPLRQRSASRPTPTSFERISTRIRTMICRSGGFALAVTHRPTGPPPAVAPSTHELCHCSHNHLSHYVLKCMHVHLLGPSVRQHSLRTCRTPTYETYDHPYVKLDIVRVVRRTTLRCFTYGPS